MSYRFATYEKRGRIAYVTLNRPEVMNALHLEAHLELAEIWEDFRDDPDVWVAILTGSGERAFSAGNDLKVTAERTANGGDVQGDARPPFGRITRDFQCPKPMIAAVNGVAVGGGLEMALACDIIIAADHARFGLPEPRVGLFAGAGGVHRLARATAVQGRDGTPADRPPLRRRGGAADRAGQRGGADRGPDAGGGTVGGGDPRVLTRSPFS